MATISSTLAINDSMTPVLRSIASALAGINAALDQIGTPSIDASGINAANRALQQTEAAQDEVTQSIQESNNAAGELWGKIKGFIAAYAGWELVKQTVAWSDELTNIKARLDAANDGTQTTKQLMQDIYVAAQNGLAPYQQMADLVGKLRSNAAEAFQSNAEAVKFAEQLNKQFIIAGASQQGTAAATFQLIQALGSGALRGEELNSILDQAPNIVQTIAKHMGVPIGQIRDLASEGKITADVIKNAILGATEETNKAFNAMPMTFNDVWTKAKNTFQMNMLGLQQVISDTINSEMFQGLMDSATRAVSTFAAVAIPIVKGTVAVIGFMQRNWAYIAPIIGTVTAAILIYKSAVVALSIAEGINKGIKLAAAIASYAKAAATGAEASATAAATAAQWGLNTAILACPIGWIIAAIIAVIGVFYLVIAVINDIAGTAYSATGIIAGIFAWLGAWMMNTIVTPAWNTILSLAEFLMNVFTHPVYSIQKLFYNLLETYTGIMLSMLKAVDPVITGLKNGFLDWVNFAIEGINWLSSALDNIGLGWGQTALITKSTTSVASDASGLRDSLLSAIDPGKAPEGYTSLSDMKLGFLDPNAEADKRYQQGADFAKDPMAAINQALGLANDPAIQAIMEGQNVGNKLAAQTAKNTAPKTEDYKYIKEIMAGKAVDRLAGTEIKIQMTNNNNVSSDQDLDHIVDALTVKLTEAMTSTAEGVHA